jgi:uncharacterized membrane protein YfcA
MMSVELHLLFLFCVALATAAQSLTGFAFGLILLGLVATLHVAPLSDVAIAVSVLTLFNAAVTLLGKRPQLQPAILKPLLYSSFGGVILGTTLLTWMSGGLVSVLRLLLGGVILLCSLMLVLQTRPKTKPSGTRSFWIAGSLTGLLSGLFASGGPPIVFHLYRQPLRYEVIRNTLVIVFAANAALRLVLIALQNQFTVNSALLSAEALPLVLGLSWVMKRYPPPLSLRTIRWIIFALLLVAGGSLVLDSLPKVFA